MDDADSHNFIDGFEKKPAHPARSGMARQPRHLDAPMSAPNSSFLGRLVRQNAG